MQRITKPFVKPILIPVLAASLFLGCGSLHAEDAPAVENDTAVPMQSPTQEQAQDQPQEQQQQQPKKQQQAGQRERGNWQERILKENPELEGVDLKSEEGQVKLRAVMQKRFQTKMAERKQEQSAALQQQLGFNEEEYAAVKPLMDRVETLNLQKSIVQPDGVQSAFAGMGRGGRSSRGGKSGGDAGKQRMPDLGKMMLGDQEMDPAATAVKDAAAALKKLLEDPQVSDDELSAAIAHVHAAREGLSSALQTARDDLRGVLNVKQEAILTDSGFLN